MPFCQFKNGSGCVGIYYWKFYSKHQGIEHSMEMLADASPYVYSGPDREKIGPGISDSIPY